MLRKHLCQAGKQVDGIELAPVTQLFRDYLISNKVHGHLFGHLFVDACVQDR